MSNDHRKITVAVHDGIFHADDAFSIALLQLTGIDGQSDFEVIRTRDEALLEGCDLRVDVGAKYDPMTGDYDHHQRGGAGKRENGVPYAAFGLLWENIGRDWIRTCLKMSFIDEAYQPNYMEVEEAWDRVEDKLAQPIDAGDNGHELYEGLKHRGCDTDIRPYTISHAISSMNLPWDLDEEDKTPEAETAMFQVAVNLARNVLQNEVQRACSLVKADSLVREAVVNNSLMNCRIIVLDKFSPWQNVLVELHEALYVAYPSNTGDWRCQCIPPEKGSFDKRKPLPESWAGLRGEELAKVTDVPDAVFCHPARFLCGAKSKESIIKMAKMAVRE